MAARRFTSTTGVHGWCSGSIRRARRTTKSYDDKGRLTVEQDPLGAVTAYQYDDAGRLVAVFPGMINRLPTSMTTASYG